MKKAGLTKLSEKKLDEMVEEATVDCYDAFEAEAGFCATLEDKLTLPFTTKIFGINVTVKSIEQGDDGIYAICVHGKEKQAIPLTELPIPSPAPEGIEWLDAYHHFRRSR